MANSTHSVVISRENRGVKFLVGCVAIFLLVKWLLTGQLFEAVAFAAQPKTEDGKTGSVSGFVIPLVFDLIIGLGGIVIALGTGVWAIVWDLFIGVRESIQLWRGTAQATLVATDQAIDSAVEQAKQAAVAPVARSTSDPMEKVFGNFKKIQTRFETLEKRVDKLDPPPPPPPPPETMEEKIARLEAAIAAQTEAEAAKPKTTRGAK